MRTFRRVRDIVLLLAVIAYSGAHLPSMHGFARVGGSFKAGYDRAIVERNASAKAQSKIIVDGAHFSDHNPI